MSKQQGAQFLTARSSAKLLGNNFRPSNSTSSWWAAVLSVSERPSMRATRGLKVALVEARDYASGTSSRSSKMFHGGLRYLEQLEFGLVREALRERELSLTTLAPHLVKPLKFLFPLAHRVWERPYMAAGIFLYDRMGGAKSVPLPEALDAGGRTAHVAEPQAQFTDRVASSTYDTVVDDASAHHDRCTDRRPLRRGRPNIDAGRGISA